MTTSDNQQPTGTATVPARPVHEERMSRVKAAVWASELADGRIRYGVTVCRVYKDRENRWQVSESFGKDDLLVLAKVLDRVHSWICDSAGGEVAA